MKQAIKKIDAVLFNSKLFNLYVASIRRYWDWCRRRNVTRLPKKISKNAALKARLNFFQQADYFFRVNRMKGVYAEFGCHEVNTFRMALNTLGMSPHNYAHHFFAFDSFEGMPEPEGLDKQLIWRAGMNATSLESFRAIVRKDLHRVTCVKGFYDESLPKANWHDDDRILLAYLDCDYYSSTVDCLNFLKDKLQHGSILFFDDWDCYYSDPLRGQRKAFSEFQDGVSATYWFEPYSHIASGGKGFVVLEKAKMGTDVL